MKRITLLIATVILSLLFTATAFGGNRHRQASRTMKPAPGSQICTGCCDPCYEDDVAKIKNRNASARKAKPTRSNPQPR
jgi:hypothetical protein